MARQVIYSRLRIIMLNSSMVRHWAYILMRTYQSLCFILKYLRDLGVNQYVRRNFTRRLRVLKLIASAGSSGKRSSARRSTFRRTTISRPRTSNPRRLERCPSTPYVTQIRQPQSDWTHLPHPPATRRDLRHGHAREEWPHRQQGHTA